MILITFLTKKLNVVYSATVAIKKVHPVYLALTGIIKFAVMILPLSIQLVNLLTKSVQFRPRRNQELVK